MFNFKNKLPMNYIRLSLVLCMFFCFHTNMRSQEQSLFSSIGASLSATTTGAELEFSTPLHKKIILRGGFSFLPYNFETSINVSKINDRDLPEKTKVDMDGKVRLYNGKILLDYFPSTKAPLFVSGGFYLGNKEIVTLEGKSDADLIWEGHTIPVENGRVKALVKTNGIKPYFGIGYGNAIPKKRLGFRFELGAMYQGVPQQYNTKGEKLDDVNVNDIDVIKLVRKFEVYPVVSFRLTGRLL